MLPSAYQVMTVESIKTVLGDYAATREKTTFVGNGAVNRAVAHGMSVEPSIILIVNSTDNYKHFIFNGSANIHYIGAASASNRYSVTAIDSTSFYVGNATTYTGSANESGTTYTCFMIA